MEELPDVHQSSIDYSQFDQLLIDIKHQEGCQDTYTYTWKGDTWRIVVSHVIFDNPNPKVFSASKKVQEVGDRFSIGPYLLEIEKIRDVDVIARRVL